MWVLRSSYIIVPIYNIVAICTNMIYRACWTVTMAGL
nr:MAG TPA: hypothetical protein [Caudoviricetes sp.]